MWNRVYDGVKFNHAATLKEVSEGNEVVYVPCHRSHMDYLLLSYIIYHQGYALPHIAAGINLNIPVVGRFLRKGGAFFIRRSFAGNALYTVVFMKYLAAIMARGHSHRILHRGRPLAHRPAAASQDRHVVDDGAQLPARPGAAGGVRAGVLRLRAHRRGQHLHLRALGRAQEEGELARPADCRCGCCASASARCTSTSASRSGSTTCSTRTCPSWREQRFDDDTRLPAVNALVGELALAIMRGINAAAAVTPINLLATTLLASPRGALPESALLRQLDLYLKLLRASPYSPRVTVTDASPAEIVDYGESLKIISRVPHKLGDVVKMSDESAQLIAYYRNNVLHLFALPSLVACAFIGNSMLRTEDIQRLAWRIYPYVASELFLRWREEELAKVVDGILAALAELGVLHPNEDRSAWMRPAAGFARRHAAVDAGAGAPSRPSSATTSPSRCCSRPAAAP